jgi:hypothetical protein
MPVIAATRASAERAMLDDLDVGRRHLDLIRPRATRRVAQTTALRARQWADRSRIGQAAAAGRAAHGRRHRLAGHQTESQARFNNGGIPSGHDRLSHLTRRQAGRGDGDADDGDPADDEPGGAVCASECDLLGRLAPEHLLDPTSPASSSSARPANGGLFTEQAQTALSHGVVPDALGLAESAPLNTSSRSPSTNQTGVDSRRNRWCRRGCKFLIELGQRAAARRSWSSGGGAA